MSGSRASPYKGPKEGQHRQYCGLNGNGHAKWRHMGMQWGRWERTTNALENLDLDRSRRLLSHFRKPLLAGLVVLIHLFQKPSLGSRCAFSHWLAARAARSNCAGTLLLRFLLFVTPSLPSLRVRKCSFSVAQFLRTCVEAPFFYHRRLRRVCLNSDLWCWCSRRPWARRRRRCTAATRVRSSTRGRCGTRASIRCPGADWASCAGCRRCTPVQPCW